MFKNSQFATVIQLAKSVDALLYDLRLQRVDSCFCPLPQQMLKDFLETVEAQ